MAIVLVLLCLIALCIVAGAYARLTDLLRKSQPDLTRYLDGPHWRD
jgi:hypothetical protein